METPNSLPPVAVSVVATSSVPLPMLEVVLAHLRHEKGRWPRVAKESGVSVETIRKVAMRKAMDPQISTVQRLFDHFTGAPPRDPIPPPDVRA